MDNNKGKRYTDEYKKNVVAIVKSGKSANQVAKEYDIACSTIQGWVRQFSTIETPVGEVSMKEFEKMRRRNAELEEEVAILKKASAIFLQNSKKG